MIRFESGESTNIGESDPAVIAITNQARNDSFTIVDDDSHNHEFAQYHLTSKTIAENAQTRILIIAMVLLKYLLIFLAVVVFPFKERLLEAARTLQTRQKAFARNQYHQI